MENEKCKMLTVIHFSFFIIHSPFSIYSLHCTPCERFHTMTTVLLLASVVALPLSLILAGCASCHSRCDRRAAAGRFRCAVGGHAAVFLVVYCAVVYWAVDSAWAQGPEPAPGEADQAAATATGGIGVGDGLGLLSVALATGLSVLGAGYAVAVVGAAALGAIAEKPELFGRSLIFVGLAEGLAIYGLIVSILILGRLG
jgi:V/A-type H+-transporting ATPase subunit K